MLHAPLPGPLRTQPVARVRQPVRFGPGHAGGRPADRWCGTEAEGPSGCCGWHHRL